jgi:hypothetical protein
LPGLAIKVQFFLAPGVSNFFICPFFLKSQIPNYLVNGDKMIRSAIS